MTAGHDQLWRDASKILQGMLNPELFNRWFAPIKPIEVNQDALVLGVANEFYQIWLQDNFLPLIREAVNQVSRQPLQVRLAVSQGLKVPPELPQPTATRQEKRSSARTDLDVKLNPRYTFDSFVVGPNSNFAHAAALAVAQSPAKAYNPLFIYGGVGLGKTHLLQSIGNEILKNNPTLKVKYITSEKFTSELINSLQNGKINDFKEHYQKIDLLIIDDIQFISGKEKTQEEFFHIFNFLYQLNKQIVLSSDRAPKAIPTLEERLRSRFEGGMIADVSKADFETRMAILSKKAQADGLEIRNDVLEFIASNITNNIRELEGALNRVAVSAQLTNKEITLDFVQGLLAELISSGKKKGVTHKHIIKIVSDFYDISQEDLVIKGRKKEVVRPRQIAMYLMRSELHYSYPGIGEKLGGRDHTTAIHAFEKITRALESDKKLSEDLAYLRERLYSLS